MGAKTEQCRKSLSACILRPSIHTESGGRPGTDVACGTDDIVSDPDNCKEVY